MATLVWIGSQVQLLDGNGDPLANGTVNFYEPGTTTAKDTYTDTGLQTTNANPVVLDSQGRANIVLNGNYKVVVKDADGATVYTVDGINPDPVTVVGTFNLIANGSFEGNTLGDNKTPDDWTLTEQSGSTVSLDTTDQRHGAQSIKFISTGSGGGDVISTAFLEVDELQAYRLAFDLKSSVADVRNLVQMHWYDSAKVLLSSTSAYDDSTTNPTSWTRQEADLTPPASARFAKLQMFGCHSSDATPGTTWFDHVTFTPAYGGLRRVTTFTASGTYTKPSWLRRAVVEVVGGGGAGGGAKTTGVGQASAGAGGGGGGYARKLIAAADIGATETVTVGPGGTGAAGATGGDGGTTSFGAHVSATGGFGGGSSPATTGMSGAGGGGRGQGSGGDINLFSNGGGASFTLGENILGGPGSGAIGFAGTGGGSYFGGGGQSTITSGTTSGSGGSVEGGGSAGAVNGQSQTAVAATDGGPGLVVVTEYE